MPSSNANASGVAARYASALFELADAAQALDETARDLGTLRQMLADSADLRRMIRNPLLTRAEQGAAMQALAERAGLSDLVRRFLGLVAQNRRLFALPAMITHYLEELSRRRGEMSADVVAARPLSDAQMTALTQAIAAKFGLKASAGKVAVNVTVDPALIGGLVVKVGSRMVDSSIRTKLDKLHLALKAPLERQIAQEL